MAFLRNKVLAAVYSRLNGNVGTGVPVYSDIAAIPEGTAPPVVAIEDLQGEDIGDKASPVYRYVVTIAVVASDASTKPLGTMFEAVHGRLHNAALSASGATLLQCRYESDDMSSVDETGLLKVGRMRFGVIVE